MSVVILVALFSVQSRGTAGIARVFGPVMVVWFAVIGVLGLRQIIDHPEVLEAVWPGYAVEFFADEPGKAFLVARLDLPRRHGRRGAVRRHGPLRSPSDPAVVVLLGVPGAAAQLLRPGGAAHRRTPEAIESPFYRLAPDWAITPLAILATMATVIASQALISGAFSMTAQAIQLDYIPRLAVRHTSGEHAGQIYVPLVNWLLMLGCVGLVLGIPLVERPRLGVRHRRHGDDGDHHAAVLPCRP